MGRTHLIPFAVSVAAYFWVFIPMEHQTILGMVLKCWPIISLQYVVFMQGIGLDDASIFKTKIFSGLMFSCLGDAFLDFPNYFLHGTASFAVAQLCYIWALGFKPLNVVLGLKVFAMMSLPLYYILPNLMKEDLMLIIVLAIYALLLKTMVWRSIARLQTSEASLSTERDWGRIFGCIGGVSFGLSDATLAFNKFYTPVLCAQAIIMFTYYFAQFGIALSVIQPDLKPEESSRARTHGAQHSASRGSPKKSKAEGTR